MTATLRIAHVSGETGFSGGEVQVFLLMEGLRARGHANLLVCPPGSRAASHAEARGFEVACVAMRNDFSLGAARAVARIFADRRPDLVHCHTGRANWLGGLAAKRVGVPAVSTRRMDRRVKPGLRTRFLYGSLMRRVAAISPAVQTRLREGGVPPERIRMIWSAIDPATLVPTAPREALRERFGASAEKRCLLVAANLVHRKGVDILLEALAMQRRDDTLAWIAGDGPERATLEAMATRLGLAECVRFLGHRNDVPDLLEACDVFVMPSRQEGLGVAALEAMARGRPVVASAVGGLAEAVIPEETGLLVPPGDASALAAALLRVVGDARFAARLGTAGARRVEEHFLADAMVAAYEILYREALADGGGGAGRAGSGEA